MAEPGQGRAGGRPSAALQGRRAGFVSRSMANVVDLCLLGLVGLATGLLANLVGDLWRGPGIVIQHIPDYLVMVVGLTAIFVYLAYFWGTTGRTPGDQLLGLRVVDLAEQRLRARRAVLRAALYVVFPAGFLWVLVSRHNASLQDHVVRSQVVYDWAYRGV